MKVHIEELSPKPLIPFDQLSPAAKAAISPDPAERSVFRLQDIHRHPSNSTINTHRPTYSLAAVAVALNTVHTASVEPAVVHFGGYKVNHTHKQTLRVINRSGDRTRFIYSPPTTPFFKIRPSRKATHLSFADVRGRCCRGCTRRW